MSSVPGDLTCRELVELVTDYLEGEMPNAELARFEAHLRICDECRDYVEQVRQTIGVAGRLDEGSLDPGARNALLESFRGWKRATGL